MLNVVKVVLKFEEGILPLRILETVEIHSHKKIWIFSQLVERKKDKFRLLKKNLHLLSPMNKVNHFSKNNFKEWVLI
jgi:hypothetical protein